MSVNTNQSIHPQPLLSSVCVCLCLCVWLCVCECAGKGRVCVFELGYGGGCGWLGGWVNLWPLFCADDSIDLLKIMWRSWYVASVWTALILIHCVSFQRRYITARTSSFVTVTSNTATDRAMESKVADRVQVHLQLQVWKDGFSLGLGMIRTASSEWVAKRTVCAGRCNYSNEFP